MFITPRMFHLSIVTVLVTMIYPNTGICIRALHDSRMKSESAIAWTAFLDREPRMHSSVERSKLKLNFVRTQFVTLLLSMSFFSEIRSARCL